MKRLLLLFTFIFLTMSNLAFADIHDECKKAVLNVMDNIWENGSAGELVDNTLKLCKESGGIGNVESQYHVSVLLMIKNDQAESQDSYKWCLMAAKNGHTYAQYRLGKMYENGVIVERDIEKAVQWYQKASENGLSLAKERLKELRRK